MQSIFAGLRESHGESPFTLSPASNKEDKITSQNSQVGSSDQAIENWLHHFGFHFNPFQTTDAERDEHLANYFVEHPDFDNLARLESRLIFARPGDGKTVLRLRLQSLYREELPRKKVFCFSYTIPLTVAENPPSDVDGHLPHILKASVRHAFVLLATHGNDLDHLQDNPVLASTFAAYFDRYLGTSFWLDDLTDALDANSIDLVAQNLKPTFDDLDLPSGWLTLNSLWLRRWIDLLQGSPNRLPLIGDDTVLWQAWRELLHRAGFRASLMLVDWIDVKPSDRSASEARPPVGLMQRMALPLLRAMQGEQFGEHTFVKLFLPVELFILLLDSLRRNDPVAIIQWSREQLGQLLAARLQAATYGAITDFTQLVAPDVHPQFSEWLITVANFSPRHLLHAIEQILRVHVAQSAAGKEADKISRRTLAKVSLRYQQRF